MWKPAILLFLIIMIGVFGYHFIEGWSFLDCFYMTVITIFTVGFKEVRTLSPQGQFFTIFIILSGVGTAIYAFTKIAEIVFEGRVNEIWRRKKMDKEIQNLKDHYIICGYGRMGRIVSHRLEEEKLPFVIIENKPEKIELLKKERKYLFIDGDATTEENLIKAGIKNAKALAALLPSDADNLYLVLTVKLISPSLFVLSKALDEEGEKKILQIGANKIVSPYMLSGLKIAQGLIRPTLVDFLDVIIRRKELSLSMEEFIVKKSSKIADKNLMESDVRKETNIIIVAVKKPGKEIIFNPSSDFVAKAGDTILVLGDKEEITKFEQSFL